MMKVTYELNKKEQKEQLNVLYGIHFSKRKIKQKKIDHLPKWSKLMKEELIIDLLYFFCILLFFSVLKEMWFMHLVLIIWIINLYIPIVITIMMIVSYQKSKTEKITRTIKINEWGMEDQTINGKPFFCSWDELEIGIETQDYLYLSSKKNNIIGIPLKKNRKQILETIEKFQREHLSIIKIEKKKKQKHLFWKTYGPIIFLTFFTIFATSYFHIQNVRLLDYEMDKIKENKLDEELYTYGVYQNREKVIKEFYQEIQKNQQILEINKVEKVFEKLTVSYLKNEKNNLPAFKKDAEENYQIAMESIDKVLKQLEKEQVEEFINQYSLDAWDQSEIKKYLNEEEIERLKTIWNNYKETNAKKQTYLVKILQMLMDKNTIWYIENDQLYMKDNQKREEYNRLYHLILDEEENI